MFRFTFLLIIVSSSFTLHSQSWFRVKVVDSESKASIQEAIVYIEEIPLGDKYTDRNGLVIYQNVPEDRKVKLNIRKPGYQFRSIDIVANRDIGPDNNIVVELSKEDIVPQKIIWGEIVNASGDEIIEATVELNIAGEVFRTESDESGNYRFKISSEIFSISQRFKIEIKANGCSDYRETIQNPSTLVFNKDFEIKCSNIYPEEKAAQVTTRERDNIQSRSVGMWTITLEGCSRQEDEVTCNFTVLSKGKDRNFAICGFNPYRDGSMIYDCNNGSSEGIGSTLANKVNPQWSRSLIIQDLPTKATIKFKNFPLDCNKIPLLHIAAGGDDYQSREYLKFRNIYLGE
jgi:hypothetical protein